MKPTHLVPVALAGALAHSVPARADIESFNSDAFDLTGALDRAVSAPRTSVEVAVAGGYTQGVGGAGTSGSVEDCAGPGGTVELQLGVRWSPQFSLGAYGTLARFRHGDLFADGSSAHGATAGVQAVWHSRASRALDPWVSAGAGWRALWLSPSDGAALSVHGVEILRVQLGIDYRFTSWFAIAPVIGVSASMFLVEGAATATERMTLHDNRLNLYGFTGILGRFDLGG